MIVILKAKIGVKFSTSLVPLRRGFPSEKVTSALTFDPTSLMFCLSSFLTSLQFSLSVVIYCRGSSPFSRPFAYQPLLFCLKKEEIAALFLMKPTTLLFGFVAAAERKLLVPSVFGWWVYLLSGLF